MELCKELLSKLNDNQLPNVLALLKDPSINQIIKSSDVNILIDVTVTTFYRCTQSYYPQDSSSFPACHREYLDEIIYESARILRNCCALGESTQNHIITVSINATQPNGSGNIFDAINAILCDIPKNQSVSMLSKKSRKMCWQFVANLSVQNQLTQNRIWTECKENILSNLSCVCECDNARECTMILYNIFIGGLIDCHSKELMELLLACDSSNTSVQHDWQNNDFHHIFMENFITKYRNIVPIYATLPSEKRLQLLYHIADHMKEPSHPPIYQALLQYVCKEFKKKSDCVLKTVTSYVEAIEPKEVIAILDVLAQASSDEQYSHVLAIDGSLFLNVGCLLQTINTIGKRPESEQNNIFAPVQKLGQLAPNSGEDCSIERDISYQLKSMLVRTLGNLAYKNKKNQELAREMDILMAVLDSTNLDARNPLIKEWSILAIRNLCENNLENQQIVRQLSKVGDAKNSDVLKEFNIDLGSLRINPN